MNKVIISVLLSLAIGVGSVWAGAVHSGVVKETMNSGGYTYMLVDEGERDVWVALPETELKVGEQVRYFKGAVMTDFTSKTLDKKFSTIIFSTGIVDDETPSGKKSAFGAAVAAEQESGAEVLGEENSPGSQGAVTTFQQLDIDKAKGANSYRVGELYADRESFAGKLVRVHGKAVKVNEAIMGKNWVHLQDGSGDPLQNSHDLVVTTTESVQEGDIVTIEGVVAVDRDFGYSYKYDILLENGKVVK